MPARSKKPIIELYTVDGSGIVSVLVNSGNWLFGKICCGSFTVAVAIQPVRSIWNRPPGGIPSCSLISQAGLGHPSSGSDRLTPENIKSKTPFDELYVMLQFRK